MGHRGLHDVVVGPVGELQVDVLEDLPGGVDGGPVRRAAQQPVEDGDGLGTGDLVIGTQGAVLFVAGEPAPVYGVAQGVIGPVVVVPIGEQGGEVQLQAFLGGEHPGEDGDELRPGDVPPRQEGRAVIVAFDESHGRHGVHIRLVPGVGGHVREGGAVPREGVHQQGVDHFRGLGSGHAVVGPDLVLVAFDVDHVLLGVKAGEHRLFLIGGFLIGGFLIGGLLTGGLLVIGSFLIGGFLVRDLLARSFLIGGLRGLAFRSLLTGEKLRLGVLLLRDLGLVRL